MGWVLAGRRVKVWRLEGFWLERMFEGSKVKGFGFKCLRARTSRGFWGLRV